MKNKALTLTILTNMTSNYGESLGNISSIQKVFRKGKVYSIRSRESLKNGIMVQSGLYDDLITTTDSGVTQKEVNEDYNAHNCRALEGGYMNTQNDIKKRNSSFYLTDAISTDEYTSETRFHNNLFMATNFAEKNGFNIQKDAKKAGLMPYQYEYSKDLKVYSITIDLDKIGIDENYNKETNQ